MRLVAPIAMLWRLGLSAAVVPASWLYAGALGAQIAFYLLALLGFVLEKMGRTNRVVSACYVFCVLNVTTLFSLYRFFIRRQSATWEHAA
jgi:biofilm PGA synthesis N-glycosyltransferase PgaC